jgi:gliding motility-associated lipoprotein GldH
MIKLPIKICLLIILLISTLSCNRGRIYNDKFTFDDYSWSKDETIKFDPEITAQNAGKQYQAAIHVRYITGFSYKFLNLGLLITRPDGSLSTKEISIQMLTEDKKYRGNGMGDIWDLDYELSEPLSFLEPGKYKIEIKSLMDTQTVNFINEIGISISEMKNSD